MPYITDGASTSGQATYENSEGLVHQFGSIQTLSVSSFREKAPVRSLGMQHAQSYTRGPRTIAGTLIFALIDKHPFDDTAGGSGNGILSSSSGFTQDPVPFEVYRENLDTDHVLQLPTVYRKHQYDWTLDSQFFGQTMYVDELPPFDILITKANEYGNLGQIKLYGVEVHSEGYTLSIHDMLTEVTYSYTARGADAFTDGKFQSHLWNSGPRLENDDWALTQLRG